MYNLGISGTPLQLLTDYLKNRTQAVIVGDIYSKEETIEYGVPQGSVLGSTLFLIYIDGLSASALVSQCLRMTLLGGGKYSTEWL